MKKELIRLNKFLAHSGLGGRRDCDVFIRQGLISVNGEIVDEPGIKVNISDLIKFKDQIVSLEKKVYILLNKPKNFDFEKNERGLSILDLIKSFPEKLNLGYSPEVRSIDALETNELGLILLTNDFEFIDTYQLNEKTLISTYNIELNKELEEKDQDLIEKGIKTTFGNFKVQEIEILDEENLNIGLATKHMKPADISILFNVLGYEIEKLDRTLISHLSKRDLPRGKWRFLTPNEVIKLKHLKY